ncbi:MAG: MFS transporter [Myxococcota bacterium]
MPPTKPRTQTLRLSVFEGALAAGMMGLGELWFVADAVRLGAGPLQLALVVTLPPLVGALGAVGMVAWLRRGSGRRARVVAMVLGQALVLAALAATRVAGGGSPWMLVAFACAYQAFGQAAGNAWSSWFGDLVPARIRGRYFGRRNRWSHAASFVALVAGGAVLQVLEPRAADAMGAGGLGFAVLYGTAATLRLVSGVLLARSYEPTAHPPLLDERPTDVFRGPDGRAARGVVSTGALMLLAVCLGSPFFAPFMLGTLQFSYTTYLVAQGVMVGFKVALLPLWGRAVDRVGARPVYLLAALLVAIVPLPWVFADGVPLVLLGQALSGSAWAAHEVSLLSLTLAAASPRQRGVLLAWQSVAHGFAMFVGGLLGAALFTRFPGAFAAVFLLTAIARLAVALAARRLLAHTTPTGPIPPARVVGWMPHGGVVRRWVPGEDGAPTKARRPVV